MSRLRKSFMPKNFRINEIKTVNIYFDDSDDLSWNSLTQKFGRPISSKRSVKDRDFSKKSKIESTNSKSTSTSHSPHFLNRKRNKKSDTSQQKSINRSSEEKNLRNEIYKSFLLENKISASLPSKESKSNSKKSKKKINNDPREVVVLNIDSFKTDKRSKTSQSYRKTYRDRNEEKRKKERKAMSFRNATSTKEPLNHYFHSFPNHQPSKIAVPKFDSTTSSSEYEEKGESDSELFDISLPKLQDKEINQQRTKRKLKQTKGDETKIYSIHQKKFSGNIINSSKKMKRTTTIIPSKQEENPEGNEHFNTNLEEVKRFLKKRKPKKKKRKSFSKQCKIPFILPKKGKRIFCPPHLKNKEKNEVQPWDMDVLDYDDGSFGIEDFCKQEKTEEEMIENTKSYKKVVKFVPP